VGFAMGVERLTMLLQLHESVTQVGPDVYLVSPDFPRFAGAFLGSGSRVFTRIDITGHCLSAMLKIRRFGSRPVR